MDERLGREGEEDRAMTTGNLICFYFFKDRLSFSVVPWNSYTPVGLEFMAILLPKPPECWDSGHVLSYPVLFVFFLMSVSMYASDEA